MASDDLKEEELKGMFDRLDHEVDVLYDALYDSGDNLDDNYSEKVIRSQLEDIGEVVEAMSKHVGDGEKISVTTPSKLQSEEEE